MLIEKDKKALVNKGFLTKWEKKLQDKPITPYKFKKDLT